eukprot:scaffold121255_cov48-Cyclotella_meneghiniana.AAC.1
MAFQTLLGRLSGFGVWSIFTGIIEHGVLVNIYFGQYLSGGKGMAFQTLLGWYIFVVAATGVFQIGQDVTVWVE